MRRQQRGFTLVELMITIAILGILASIAMPAFMQYMKKSKLTEADLALDAMAKKARVYYMAKGSFPPSGSVMPTTQACYSGTGKTNLMLPSDWQADPGFGPLEFHLDEPGYFQFEWINAGVGVPYAFADLDCDNQYGTRYQFLIPTGDGNLTTSYFDFMNFD